MKWTTPKPKVGPKEDALRLRRTFAFLPKRCTDGTTRWLEKIVVLEKYYRDDIPHIGTLCGWDPVEYYAAPPVRTISAGPF